jgi:uncharacterized membrane protein YfcA
VSASLIELVAVGVLAGSFGAVLGVGGGIILVPGLILVAGLPFHSAVAASLVCVSATSVAGSAVYMRAGRVDLDAGVRLQLFTVFGAVAAGLVAVYVPAAPLYLAFALLLLVTSYRMWPRSRHMDAARAAPAERRPLAAGASVGAGVVAGLLGVGGGILNVPILHMLLGMPFDRSVATSVYMIGVTAAGAALVYLARGDVALGVAGVAMIGTMAGAGFAAALGGKLNQRALKLVFALLLLYVAFRMGSRGLAEF